MSQKNGVSGEKKDSQIIRKEINYWKAQSKKRKCSDFSEMSYWEVMSTNSAL
ncbi:hypothetical protein [Aquimarina muelleri]|uniref:Uncharacterized protein n=1 Tax=Aquimarina muelleri TaxID=279356 RepID=A0A918JS95_9FLAO|nr:hypothetical protein [Aquimarina muelleri]MCX2763116.1 hypothetical protein [Aquimarina muelleri]GGX06536.1 hypothetical protein GCM10007384_05310 [Aquimarina muelleri]